ncbi:hypothetical protein [Candidatus Amarolinea dominans]|uniref:hypothetical protein n=1 Tax=Candidatus Amarolinea dominans TaxID=3140696 RepID=UPI0031CC971F
MLPARQFTAKRAFAPGVVAGAATNDVVLVRAAAIQRRPVAGVPGSQVPVLRSSTTFW